MNNNIIKDKVFLVVTALTVSISLIFSAFLQVKTQESWLKYIFILYGFFIFLYYGHFSIVGVIEKKPKLRLMLLVVVCLNAIFLSMYLYLCFFNLYLMKISIFAHGLIMAVEITMLKLLVEYMVERLKKTK